jgi:hypothetical protein
LLTGVGVIYRAFLRVNPKKWRATDPNQFSRPSLPGNASFLLTAGWSGLLSIDNDTVTKIFLSSV